MIKKLLSQSVASRRQQRQAELRHKLLLHEAKIGGQLFGSVPASERRDFFCLDSRTWVWHEEWTDQETGKRKSHTTRYEVRPDCILKVRDGQYKPVSQEEAHHLYDAAKAYQSAVQQQLYQPAAS